MYPLLISRTARVPALKMDALVPICPKNSLKLSDVMPETCVQDGMMTNKERCSEQAPLLLDSIVTAATSNSDIMLTRSFEELSYLFSFSVWSQKTPG